MQVEIITIGDELLIGQIVDTNSAWMAVELNKSGFQIAQITSVHDSKAHILEALGNALKRADIVLFTGGIGPTKDDITKQTLCSFFDANLVFNQQVYNDIESLLKTRARAMNELTISQAMVPDNATIIRNPIGTAPITWYDYNGKVVVSMPGVPYEMKHSMTNEIIPRLKIAFQTPSIVHQTVIVKGYPESALAIKIADWENALPDELKLAYLPNFNIVRLRLSAATDNIDFTLNDIRARIADLRVILGDAIIAEEDLTLEELIGSVLINKGLRIATAESCTGGHIAHKITSVPGSSAYFTGGVVAYDNALKTSLLDVDPELFESVGAVSHEVVEQMARGAMRRLNADVGVASSGIAGPGGGTPEKPVGFIWISVCTKDKIWTKSFQFKLSRSLNIERSTQAALLMAIELINDQHADSLL